MGKFAETLKHVKLLEAMTFNDAVKVFQDHGVENPQSMGKNELKKAWRSLMGKFHPDRAGEKGKQVSQILNQAHDLLAGRTAQGRKAAGMRGQRPSGGGFRGAARGAKAYQDTEEMGTPPWQTDARASFNSISRPDYTDVNFIKRDMWVRSGKSRQKWTIWGHDGSFFRGDTTVFGNKGIFNEMAEAMRVWQSKGGNPYPTRAVFVSPEKGDKKLYLVYLDGHFLGGDPYVMEHDSFNLNPSNDQSFMRSLPKKFDEIAAELGGQQTESEDVNENSSAGSVSAGSIASSVTGVGSRPGDKKKGKKKKAPTIFAVSEGDVIPMGGERKSPDHLSPQQINVLKNRYAGLQGIDPESPTYQKLTDFLDNSSDTLLKQLSMANIKFVSKLARNRVMRRGLDEKTGIDPETFEEIAIIRRRAGIEEAKFNIPDRPKGDDIMSLETWFRQIYAAYPEYNNPEYGGGDFMAMVKKFAEDDFYKGHHEAKRYLELKNEQ